MNSNKNKSKSVFFVILLIFLQSVIFIYIKYSNQSLPLSYFNPDATGNVINLITYLLIILGLTFYLIRRSSTPQPQLLIYYSYILTALLILCFVVKNLNPFESDKQFYFIGQPFYRLVNGASFILYYFTLIYFLFFIWYGIFKRNRIPLSSALSSFTLMILILVGAFIYESGSYEKGWEKKLDNNRNNIVVVLGAAVWSDNKPSPSLAVRVDKAAELYKNGFARTILLTGSNAPGELSEAQVAFNYLLNYDIDTADVKLEDNTTSTTEQIHYIKMNLIDKKQFDNVIVISESYHLNRVFEICRFYNFSTIAVPSELILSSEDELYYRLRESIALVIFWFFAL